jgi:hypothetical protein
LDLSGNHLKYVEGLARVMTSCVNLREILLNSNEDLSNVVELIQARRETGGRVKVVVFNTQVSVQDVNQLME